MQYDKGDYIPGKFPFWINCLYLPDIWHDFQDWRWCTFSNRCTFFAKRMWMMAYFSPFRPRLVTLLQVPALLVGFFYRFKKCGGVPKLTNIRYESLSFSKKQWFAKYFLWQHWLNLFCHPASHFEPGGGWNCPCLKTCQGKSGSTRTKCEKDCNCWNVIVIPQNFA